MQSLNELTYQKRGPTRSLPQSSVITGVSTTDVTYLAHLLKSKINISFWLVLANLATKSLIYQLKTVVVVI